MIFRILVTLVALTLAACSKAPVTPLPAGDRTAIRAAIARGEATIVFVGDSITAGSNVPYESSWPALMAKDLRSAYPNVRFRFVNLALPGRSLVQALDDHYVALDHETAAAAGYFMPMGSTPLWAGGSTPGQSWKQAVIAQSPDLVVIAFGMNDISGDGDAFRKISDWLASSYQLAASHPSIAMVATILPSRAATEYRGLEGNIDKSAEAARMAARDTGATLIDANAYLKRLRDGKARYALRLLGGAELVLFGGVPLLGGNGINHPSVIGHRLIYREAYMPLIKALDPGAL